MKKSEKTERAEATGKEVKWVCYMVAPTASMSGKDCASHSADARKAQFCQEKGCLSPYRVCSRCRAQGTLVGNYFAVPGKGLCQAHLDHVDDPDFKREPGAEKPIVIPPNAKSQPRASIKPEEQEKEDKGEVRFIDLSPLERSDAIKKLWNKLKHNGEEIADELGINPKTVTKYSGFFLRLIPEVQASVRAGKPTFWEAMEMIALNKEEQLIILEKIKKKGSYSTVVEEVKRFKLGKRGIDHTKTKSLTDIFKKEIPYPSLAFSRAIVEALGHRYSGIEISFFLKQKPSFVEKHSRLAKITDALPWEMLQRGEISIGKMVQIADSCDQKLAMKTVPGRSKNYRD